MEEYYCKSTGIIVYDKRGLCLPRSIVQRMTIKDLLESKVRALDTEVSFRRDKEDKITFLCRGVDYHQRFSQEEPAKYLLDRIQKLGSYYDKETKKFYF